MHANTETVLPGTSEEHVEVVQFFERFARALTTGDSQTIASLWETPAYAIGDEGADAIGSVQDLAGFFASAKGTYDAKGVIDTHPDVELIEWATERLVVCDVRWPWLDANGQEQGDERATYLLRRGSDGQLKLRVAIMRGGSQTRH